MQQLLWRCLATLQPAILSKTLTVFGSTIRPSIIDFVSSDIHERFGASKEEVVVSLGQFLRRDMRIVVAWLTLVVQVQVSAIAVQAGQIVLHSLENADASCLSTGSVHLVNVSVSAQVTDLRELIHDAHEHDVVKM